MPFAALSLRKFYEAVAQSSCDITKDGTQILLRRGSSIAELCCPCWLPSSRCLFWCPSPPFSRPPLRWLIRLGGSAHDDEHIGAWVVPRFLRSWLTHLAASVHSILA